MKKNFHEESESEMSNLDLLKGHYDEKIVCLLLISIRHHLNIHLQDAFSFLISGLALEIFIF